MLLILQKAPFCLSCLVKFFKFRNILAHEQKLFAGMGHHIAVSKSQVCKLVLSGSGHLPNHRCLAMNHFIMGEYRHEIFTVLVDHAEGQFIVMMSTEIGIKFNIIQIIIHKAHVPLHIKAKTVILRISRHLWPGC